MIRISIQDAKKSKIMNQVYELMKKRNRMEDSVKEGLVKKTRNYYRKSNKIGNRIEELLEERKKIGVLW
jgi:uncharacterized coiled-coil DUF342 family protein